MEIYFLVTRFLFRLNIHVEYKDIHLVFAQSFPENQQFFIALVRYAQVRDPDISRIQSISEI